MKNEYLEKIVSTYSGHSFLAVNKDYLKLLQPNAALVFMLMVDKYIELKKFDKLTDGEWFYFTREDLESVTRLGRRAQQSCIDKLLHIKFIDIKRKTLGQKEKRFFKINFQIVVDTMTDSDKFENALQEIMKFEGSDDKESRVPNVQEDITSGINLSVPKVQDLSVPKVQDFSESRVQKVQDNNNIYTKQEHILEQEHIEIPETSGILPPSIDQPEFLDDSIETQDQSLETENLENSSTSPGLTSSKGRREMRAGGLQVVEIPETQVPSGPLTKAQKRFATAKQSWMKRVVNEFKITNQNVINKISKWLDGLLESDRVPTSTAFEENIIKLIKFARAENPKNPYDIMDKVMSEAICGNRIQIEYAINDYKFSRHVDAQKRENYDVLHPDAIGLTMEEYKEKKQKDQEMLEDMKQGKGFVKGLKF